MNCHLREEVKCTRVDQVLILGHDHPIFYTEILIIYIMITIVYALLVPQGDGLGTSGSMWWSRAELCQPEMISCEKKPGHNSGKQTARWLENPTIFSRFISLISLKPQWVVLLSEMCRSFRRWRGNIFKHLNFVLDELWNEEPCLSRKKTSICVTWAVF